MSSLQLLRDPSLASSIYQLNFRVVEVNTEWSVNLQACITGEWGATPFTHKSTQALVFFYFSLSPLHSPSLQLPPPFDVVSGFKWSVSHTITVIWEHARLVRSILRPVGWNSPCTVEHVDHGLPVIHFRRVCRTSRKILYYNASGRASETAVHSATQDKLCAWVCAHCFVPCFSLDNVHMTLQDFIIIPHFVKTTHSTMLIFTKWTRSLSWNSLSDLLCAHFPSYV
jgi:hypothetical protein